MEIGLPGLVGDIANNMATPKQQEFISNIIIDNRLSFRVLQDIVEKYAGEGNYYYINANARIHEKVKDMTNDEVQEIISTFHYQDRKVGKANRAFNIINKYL